MSRQPGPIAERRSLFVDRRHLHVLVMEDRIHSHLGHLEGLEEFLLRHAATTQLHGMDHGLGYSVNRARAARLPERIAEGIVNAAHWVGGQAQGQKASAQGYR